MTKRALFNFFFILTFTAFLGIFISNKNKVEAAGCNWTGTTNGLWSVSTNWGAGCTGAGGIPGSGDDISFPAGPTTLVTTDDLGTVALNSITLTGSDYALNASGGSTITLATNITNGTGNNTISIPITLSTSASHSFTTGSGSLSITGNVVLPNTPNTLTINSAAYVTTSGTISGTGNIDKTGTGQWAVSGNNTYSGTTTITDGNAAISSNNGFGTTAGGTSIANGATINIYGPGLVIPEPLTLNGGNGNVGGGAIRNFTGDNTWSGNITLAAATTYIQSDAPLFLTLSGIISGVGNGLNLVGGALGSGGGIFLTNDNTYTGVTNVTGIVFINGDQGGSNVDITSSSGDLAGNGNVGNVNVTQTASAVIPAVSEVAPGILNTGDISFNGASGQFVGIFLFTNTVGTGYGQINVSGTVALNSATGLQLAGSYTPYLGDVFTIVNNDGAEAILNTFSGLAEGATITDLGGTFQISYAGGSGNDITLTVVKAPTTTTLVSSVNPSYSGQAVKFTATVHPSGSTTATGTVKFYNGATLIGTGTVNGSNKASITVSNLSVGTHNITAVYQGDGNYNQSTSSVLHQKVNKSLAATGVKVPYVGAGAVILMSAFALVMFKKKMNEV